MTSRPYSLGAMSLLAQLGSQASPQVRQGVEEYARLYMSQSQGNAGAAGGAGAGFGGGISLSAIQGYGDRAAHAPDIQTAQQPAAVGYGVGPITGVATTSNFAPAPAPPAFPAVRPQGPSLAAQQQAVPQSQALPGPPPTKKLKMRKLNNPELAGSISSHVISPVAPYPPMGGLPAPPAAAHASSSPSDSSDVGAVPARAHNGALPSRPPPLPLPPVPPGHRPHPYDPSGDQSADDATGKQKKPPKKLVGAALASSQAREAREAAIQAAAASGKPYTPPPLPPPPAAPQRPAVEAGAGAARAAGGAAAGGAKPGGTERSHAAGSGAGFAKARGALDPDRNCCVVDPTTGLTCHRSITCKSHGERLKRAVVGRSAPLEVLVQRHQAEVRAQARERALANPPPPAPSPFAPIPLPPGALPAWDGRPSSAFASRPRADIARLRERVAAAAALRGRLA